MRLGLAVVSGRNIPRWTYLPTAVPQPPQRHVGHSRTSQLCPSRVVLEGAARLSQCLGRAILELLGVHGGGCYSELTSLKIFPLPTYCETDQLNNFGPLAAASSRPGWVLH